MHPKSVKPLIAITGRHGTLANDAPPFTGSYVTYLDSILAAGGLPLILPCVDEPQRLRELYQISSAVLFPGGSDIDPARYGEEPHPKLGEIDRKRDELEFTVLEWAKVDRRPIMGICRGLQLINVGFGGTLFQDIRDQRAESAAHHDTDWDEIGHQLKLERDSVIARAAGAECLSVNSLHHQAIRQLGSGLRAVGISDDGLIEAIEGLGEQFILGVQCHPESLWQRAEGRWLGVFREFIKRAADYRASS